MGENIIGSGWAFPFKINPRGGIALTNEKDEIEQAVLIILGTPVGTRVMRPTFGSRLHELIFAPNNSHTAAQARHFVEDALGMWEPRIRVLEIDAHPHTDQENCLVIDITYQVKATHDKRSLVYPFYLIPKED